MEDHNSGHRKRLKDRFISSPKSIPDYELAELILFNAIPRKDVKLFAKKIVSNCENFGKVLELDSVKLKAIDDKIPSSVALQFAIIRESISRSLSSEMKERITLGSGDAVKEYLVGVMAHREVENFRILYLSTKNQLITEEIQEFGTVDQTQVYPREIIKKAIFYGASAIILAHNHPSGVPNPSKADIIMTNKIVEACKAIDVAVHDHVIVGGKKVFSFRSNNLL
jgi:DNA repair protein RadC